MKAHKILIFIIFTWLLATIPWLLTKALMSQDWIRYSLIFGTANTIVVVIFLLLWGVFRRKFNFPSSGFSLAGLYLLLTIIFLITGFLDQTKEPLIWEGVGPIIIMLCPVTMIVRFLNASWFVSLGLLGPCFGAIYYFLLGRAFDKFVLPSKIS